MNSSTSDKTFYVCIKWYQDPWVWHFVSFFRKSADDNGGGNDGVGVQKTETEGEYLIVQHDIMSNHVMV